ncbi:putative Phytocyanin domain, cupredoxin [Helianthus annuus]|uniref:Phytocyanin domain, cupredoxin n=1 Tax=Helianthus annuus TaxID=4232 RepID=A0A251TMU3_HELAN|nr:basic blue protein [Helianthus annuus]KAF5817534.1 putative Phytocyanin domain, cupredoxin [Helianthus annuus]KAJ0950859.1 putative Phytocyanin domain, cupredoxin [Helianthus annuus]
MAEGKGGTVVVIMVICLLVMALQCDAYPVCSSYVVGGKTGWNKNFNNGWLANVALQPCDKFVFNYPKGKHNVAVVNKTGFDGCKTTPSDKVYTSGKDEIALKDGANYFICSIPGQCPPMKIKVDFT